MDIFVAKLNFSTTPDTLRATFEEFGEVGECKIIMDKFTQKSKGYGFVEMPNDGEALVAIQDLNDSNLDGNQIVVKKSTPKPKDDRGGGGYNRNNRY